MNNGIIANDVKVLPGQTSVRIPIEVWKDDKMLFPNFDESIGGRNLILNSHQKIFAPWPPTRFIWYYLSPVFNEISNGQPMTLIVKGSVYPPNTVFGIYQFVQSIGNTRVAFTGLGVNGIFTARYNWRPIIHRLAGDVGIYINTYNSTDPDQYLDIERVKLEEGNNPNPVWTPAPEEILTNAILNPVNCQAAVDGNDIVLSNFTENQGWVDIQLSYGDDWVQTKRVYFQKKNVIQDIQLKGHSPFRAWFAKKLIWYKYFDVTKAVFDYALEMGYTLPTNKLAYDDLIRRMYYNGLISLLDLFYIFSGDASEAFRLINIINPGTYNGTALGGLMWSNAGMQGNGVNGYVSTEFNPSLLVPGQKYQMNDAGRSGVISDIGTVTANAATMDCVYQGYNHLRYLSDSNNRAINIGSSYLSGPVDLSGVGLKSINRFSTEDIIVINRNNIFNNSTTLSVLPTGKQVILRGIFSTNYSDAIISTYFMGAALTFEQTQLFREIFNQYLTAIGQEPIA